VSKKESAPVTVCCATAGDGKAATQATKAAKATAVRRGIITGS